MGNQILCRKTRKVLATKLGGGLCVCTDHCIEDESPPQPLEVFTCTTTVRNTVDYGDIEWSMTVEAMPDSWFYFKPPRTLSMGDRVKITIIKEPADALPR